MCNNPDCKACNALDEIDQHAIPLGRAVGQFMADYQKEHPIPSDLIHRVLLRCGAGLIASLAVRAEEDAGKEQGIMCITCGIQYISDIYEMMGGQNRMLVRAKRDPEDSQDEVKPVLH